MKNYLFLSAVGAMMLAACSNDDTVPVESPDVALSLIHISEPTRPY